MSLPRVLTARFMHATNTFSRVKTDMALIRRRDFHHFILGHQPGAVPVGTAIDQPPGSHLLADPVAGGSNDRRRLDIADLDHRPADPHRAAHLPSAAAGVSSRPPTSRVIWRWRGLGTDVIAGLSAIRPISGARAEYKAASLGSIRPRGCNYRNAPPRWYQYLAR